MVQFGQGFMDGSLNSAQTLGASKKVNDGRAELKQDSAQKASVTNVRTRYSYHPQKPA